MQVRTVLAVAAWSFVGIVAFGQGAQKKNKLTFGPLPTAEARIDAVQKGYQAALGNLDMSKLRDVLTRDSSGKFVTIKVPKTFVTGRMPTFNIMHDKVIRETDVPAFVQTPGAELLFWAVSAQGKPLTPGKISLQKTTATDVATVTAAQQKDIEAFASSALPELASKDVFTGQIEGSDAQARPLRLSKPECLSCHPGMKVGDPAAIMVYMIKKNKKS